MRFTWTSDERDSLLFVHCRDKPAWTVADSPAARRILVADFTPNPLFDPDWKEVEKPWVPFGKIAIANSDAGASACTDVAIDQAWRAVSELLRG